jgi:TolA-binding protein
LDGKEAEVKSKEITKAERLEKEAARLLAFDGTDEPAPRLDDLYLRRWINEIVEQSEKVEIDEPVADHRFIARRHLFASLGILVAACAAIGMFILILKHEDTRPNAAPTIAEPEGQVMMLTGEVTIEGRPVAANQRVRSGDQIRTSDGTAIMRLPGGVVVRLEDHSSVTMIRSVNAPSEVFLDTGRVTAAVDHSLHGEVAFAVSTKIGRVEVTGTLFAVENRLQQVEVLVLKGTVRARVQDRLLKIEGGRGTVLGLDRTRNLTSIEISKLEKSAEALSPFRFEVPQDEAGNGALLSNIENETEAETETGMGSADESDSNSISSSHTKTGKVRASIDSEIREDSLSLLETEGLLETAGRQRRGGDLEGAENTYLSVLSSSTDSSEIGIALIALGEITLEHRRDSDKALEYFDDYLKRYPIGVLAQEAAYGRIRALRQAGGTEEERTALERFLEAYPDAVQSGPAEKRLETLRATDSFR